MCVWGNCLCVHKCVGVGGYVAVSVRVCVRVWGKRLGVCTCICFGGCVAVSVRVCVCLEELCGCV